MCIENQNLDNTLFLLAKSRIYEESKKWEAFEEGEM